LYNSATFPYGNESEQTEESAVEMPLLRLRRNLRFAVDRAQEDGSFAAGRRRAGPARYAKSQSYMVLLDNKSGVQEFAVPEAVRYVGREDGGVLADWSWLRAGSRLALLSQEYVREI
jgi:hypothetical protein